MDGLSDNRHFEFERFVTCLCEYEICRNIKPSTGPVAGGDTGEDASIYPVADVNKRQYFNVGKASEVIGDNWYFAFSTKKNWSSKVREDIKKVSRFKPKPKKQFFCSFSTSSN